MSDLNKWEAFVGGVLFSVVVWLCLIWPLTVSTINGMWKREAVKQGCAKYHTQTGEWGWIVRAEMEIDNANN